MLSKARRDAVVAAAGYLVSPVDLVPGFIPVLGQLDDLAFALAALRLALDGLHPDRRRMHLEAVGLEDAHLAEDIRTVGATVAWIAADLRLTGPAAPRGGRSSRRPARGSRPTTASAAGQRPPGAGRGLGRVGRRIHGERPDRATDLAGSGSHSTQRLPSHQRCQVNPSVPAANTSSRSAPQELAAGVDPGASAPPSDSHACQLVPSQ